MKKNNNRFHSLKMKFAFYNFIAILIIVIMSIIYSVVKFSDLTHNNLQDVLKNQAIAADTMLTNKISLLDGINENIVKDNSFVVPLKLGIDTQVIDYFSTINSKYDEISDVVVIDSKKELYKSTDKYANLLEKAKSAFEKDDKSISGIVYTQSMSVVSIKPVYGGRSYEDKTLIGIVLIAHDLSKDFDFISSIGKNLGANIALFQNNKMIAISGKNGKIQKPSNKDVLIKVNEVFSKSSYFSKETINLLGKNYFVYMKTIKNIENKPIGVILTAEPSDKYYSDLFSIVLSLAIIGLIGLGIGLFLIILISSILTKPIIFLTKCIQIAQTGDLTVEAQCNTNDEIKILATGFNDMISNLRNIVKMIKEKSNIISDIHVSLNESYTNVNTHMVDINKSVISLNETFNENAARINDVNAGMEEIVASVQEVVAYTNDTQNKSEKTANEASKVMYKVKDAIIKSSEVVDETHILVKLINELENASRNIEDIVTVITGITNQTNLLALNAAIEAARAGEHGAGFSIVAKEMSSLAYITKEHAGIINTLNTDIMSKVRDVTNKMKNNLNKVETSREIVNELGTVLGNLTNFIENIDKSMLEVVMSAERQAASTQEITASVDTIASNSSIMSNNVLEIATVVEDEKNLVENTMVDISNLQGTIKQLMELVSAFKV